MLHGLWTAGAVATAFIALLISSSVSLNWHIYPLISIVLLLKLRAFNRLKPILLKGNEVTEEDEIVTLGQMMRSFSIDSVSGSYARYCVRWLWEIGRQSWPVRSLAYPNR